MKDEFLSTTQEDILSTSELPSITNVKPRCLGSPKRVHATIKSMAEFTQTARRWRGVTREYGDKASSVMSTEGSLKCISRNFPSNKAKSVGMENASCKFTHDLLSNGIWCYFRIRIWSSALRFYVKVWQWPFLLWNKVIVSFRFDMKV